MDEFADNITIGLLAHVDAGKTTLSEAILYACRAISRSGRVDHKDTFLDTSPLEKQRGITIFAKEAVFTLGAHRVTLLDTPGHADFSGEMERTLQVLDYAVLIISAPEGVQSHTETLWHLLSALKIPTFLFVNKTDQPNPGPDRLTAELQEHLGSACMDFTQTGSSAFYETAAMTSEAALEEFLAAGTLSDDTIAALIRGRLICPVYFGSALKAEGIDRLLAGLDTYMRPRQYPDAFAARIFKISRDEKGTRLAHLKVTGGELKVKETVQESHQSWSGKVNEIRIYSGAGFTAVPAAAAGMICAVTGLDEARSGDTLGMEDAGPGGQMTPILSYAVIWPPEQSSRTVLMNLQQLAEEDPLLRPSWHEQTGEIHLQLMGEVQTGILAAVYKERFGHEIHFERAGILYRETIAAPVIGSGHFEPLRHYAEVHLLMEPLPAGSGIICRSRVSEDQLARNWQNQVLSYLRQAELKGVLTGAPLTDIRITLIAGCGHLKHTEGGDFQEAAGRAVRQGLMEADSILLEPIYQYKITTPPESIGRVMADIQRFGGTFSPPLQEAGRTILRGTAPSIYLADYGTELAAFTGGRGTLSYAFDGYAPAHDQAAAIAAGGYDPDADTAHPSASVFCSHGSGDIVPWTKAKERMHVQYEDPLAPEPDGREESRRQSRSFSAQITNDEIDRIMEQTYGRRKEVPHSRQYDFDPAGSSAAAAEPDSRGADAAGPSAGAAGRRPARSKENYLLVDGYNIIFAWENLNTLADASLDAAREKLIDILSNYQAYTGVTLILVFDAYRVAGHPEEIRQYKNLYVVYTKEAETADQYIEKTVHQMGRKHNVRVATSDRLEQIITLGGGAQLLSAREFQADVEAVSEAIREDTRSRREETKNYLFHHAGDELAAKLEDIRTGRDDDSADDDKK